MQDSMDVARLDGVSTDGRVKILNSILISERTSSPSALVMKQVQGSLKLQNLKLQTSSEAEFMIVKEVYGQLEIEECTNIGVGTV